MVFGNLGNQRIHHSDYIHPRFHIILRHPRRHTAAVTEEIRHRVLVIIHIHKNIISPQMGRQRKRAADQPIQRRILPHSLLHPTHHIQDHRDPSGFLRRDRTITGNMDFIIILQRMGHHRRRRILRPGQAAAQTFRFNLKVKNHRLSKRLIQLIHFHQ